MSHNLPVPFVANGDIRPYRICKLDANGPKLVLEADANEAAIGISQGGLMNFPGSGTTLAAEDDRSVGIYTNGSICLLELGGTVDEGNFIKSDADGKGVAAATTGTTKQQIAAKCLEGGGSGAIVRVLVQCHEIFPALA